MPGHFKPPQRGEIPILPPESICLAANYDEAHPGLKRYTGGPCPDCVPADQYERIRSYLETNPQLADHPETPGNLDVPPEVYAKVVSYFRTSQTEGQQS